MHIRNRNGKDWSWGFFLSLKSGALKKLIMGSTILSE
jgi:hypothetical protein